jgi:hypothetical protein
VNTELRDPSLPGRRVRRCGVFDGRGGDRSRSGVDEDESKMEGTRHFDTASTRRRWRGQTPILPVTFRPRICEMMFLYF